MFRNRRDAGRLLAHKLAQHGGRPGTIVLGLSRGGLAVAHEVARQLGLPLDLFLVRKLAVPGNRLLTLGAVAGGGTRVLDRAVIEDLGLDTREVSAIERRERDELRRLESFYRDDREPLQLHDRVLIAVDEGIASGATMLAAIACARTRAPRRIVAAAPVGSAKACAALIAEADEVAVIERPERYLGVPQWYDDFAPVSAELAHDLLARHEAHEAP